MVSTQKGAAECGVGGALIMAIVAIIKDSKHKSKPFIAVMIISIVCANDSERLVMYTILKMTIITINTITVIQHKLNKLISVVLSQRKIYPCTISRALITQIVSEFIELLFRITIKPFIAVIINVIVYVNGLEILKPFITTGIKVSVVHVNGQELFLAMILVVIDDNNYQIKCELNSGVLSATFAILINIKTKGGAYNASVTNVIDVKSFITVVIKINFAVVYVNDIIGTVYVNGTILILKPFNTVLIQLIRYTITNTTIKSFMTAVFIAVVIIISVSAKRTKLLVVYAITDAATIILMLDTIIMIHFTYLQIIISMKQLKPFIAVLFQTVFGIARVNGTETVSYCTLRNALKIAITIHKFKLFVAVLIEVIIGIAHVNGEMFKMISIMINKSISFYNNTKSVFFVIMSQLCVIYIHYAKIYPCTIIAVMKEFIELFQQITTKPFIAEMMTAIVYVNGKVLEPFIAIKINVPAVYVNGQNLLLTNTTLNKCRMKLNYGVHSALFRMSIENETKCGVSALL